MQSYLLEALQECFKDVVFFGIYIARVSHKDLLREFFVNLVEDAF
jgi:hypothetical protein